MYTFCGKKTVVACLIWLHNLCLDCLLGNIDMQSGHHKMLHVHFGILLVTIMAKLHVHVPLSLFWNSLSLQKHSSIASL